MAETAAGLPRVLAACAYDALLSAAIVFTGSAVAVAVVGGNAVPAGDPLFRLYLLALAFPYYGYCWTHGGQTLGMRTWRVKAIAAHGATVSWSQAVLRYLGAVASLFALGLGFAWILIDREHRSWHDLVSRTRLVVPASRSKR